jgi:hypothetical protein
MPRWSTCRNVVRSLSPQAIEAINTGAKIADFWHTTG